MQLRQQSVLSSSSAVFRLFGRYVHRKCDRLWLSPIFKIGSTALALVSIAHTPPFGEKSSQPRGNSSAKNEEERSVCSCAALTLLSECLPIRWNINIKSDVFLVMRARFGRTSRRPAQTGRRCAQGRRRARLRRGKRESKQSEKRKMNAKRCRRSRLNYFWI